MRHCLNLCAGILLAGGAFQAHGQAVFGSVTEARVLPLREQLEREAKDSRFRLGPIRLHPRLSLQGPTYTNNVRGTVGDRQPDWTGTVVGGVRYIVPAGTRVFVRGEISPSYYYALNATELRRFGWVNHASLFAFLGKVTIEATGGYERETVPLSSEDLQPVGLTSTRFAVTSELDLFAKISLVGEVAGFGRRYDTTGSTPTSATQISSLEGDDLLLRGGLRYRLSSFLMLGGSYERSRFRYTSATNRNNDETGYVVSAQYQRIRLALNGLVGIREFRASDSSFPSYSGVTGAVLVSYQLLRPLTLQASWTRNLVGSTYLENPYFVETRYGAGFGLQLGRRIDLHGIFEIGTNRYPLVLNSGAVTPVARKDDVTVLKGDLSVRVFRAVRLVGGVSRSRYTSNIPGQDRSVLAFTTTLDFGGLELLR
ncbi:MAG: hypothetical protein ABIQ65_18740 [Thermoanaerobaculia bacterium]